MVILDIAEAHVYTATFYWSEIDELVQYPFHLGTDEAIARECVADRWQWRSTKGDRGFPESVALWHRGRVVDYYLGPETGWSSDREDWTEAPDLPHFDPDRR